MGCMSCGKPSAPKTQRPATQTVLPTRRIVSGNASNLYGSPKVRMSFSSKKRD